MSTFLGCRCAPASLLVLLAVGCAQTRTIADVASDPVAVAPDPAAVPAAASPDGYAALDAEERALVREVLAGGTLAALAPGGLDEGADRPSHVEARIKRGKDLVVFKVRDCAATFAELHQRTARTIESGSFAVDLSPFGATVAGRTVASLAEPCADLLSDGSAQSTDQITASIELHAALGPIVTLAETRSEARAGGPPYHGDRWITVDLRTGEPASLTALVTEASLVEAMKADPYLRTHLPAESLESLRAAKTVEQALEASAAPNLLVSRSYSFVPERSKGRVAMRVAFRAYASGMDPNRVRTLGLWVQPRPEAKAWFDATR